MDNRSAKGGNKVTDTMDQVATRPANRLADETSPYLLQHAHNPVDWHPWGPEALDRAKRENKPIFLSVGYSSCHWCHVMERESFEDPDTAAILDAHFIAIKVDREERPDLDEVYMTAVQMMTGGGGWPLSAFLTPDLEPFFGGTYFPPDDRHGMPGFKRVLVRLASLWEQGPEDLSQHADKVVRAMREASKVKSAQSGQLDASVLSRAMADLKLAFDAEWGGFGEAPKFPPWAAISLILRQQAGGDDDLLKMATVTLDRMACGGMYDQVGGGFHRYSTDAQWLVPHFEKMLYDNALLARVYLEAWQVTGKDFYRRVATQTMDYVLRDMTDERGGFHSAEDADSEGEEGLFYVWGPEEIRAVLGEEDGDFFGEFHGVTEAGNFEGHNILHVPRGRDLAGGVQWERLDTLGGKLLEARERRRRPGKDDKVLAAWNGMMISALARGCQILGEQRFLEAAERAADFVLTEMVRDGVLLRVYRCGGPGTVGRSKQPAYLDDHAEMAAALLDLYETTFDPRRLEAADQLAGKMVADFWDDERGGFFYTSDRHKDLLVRTKPYYDGAVPSGNSTAAMVLLRLAKLLDKADHAERADATLASAREAASAQPRAYLGLLCAADFQLRPTREIVVAGRPNDHQTRELLDLIHGRFIPNRVLAFVGPDAPGADAARDRIPLLRGKEMIGGKTTVYVCENSVCGQPVTEGTELEKILVGAR